MAFMTTPAAAARNNEPRVAVLGFNAKAGRLVLIDRVQGPTGKWRTQKDLSNAVQEISFAVDFGRLDVGWIFFPQPKGAPVFVTAPYGEQCPAQPASPGTDSDGDPLYFKSGFRLPVYGRAIGGVREFAGNAAVVIAGMNALHSEFEADARARAGLIPAVRLADLIAVDSGQSMAFQPVFEIVAWIERPAELGERTVAPPGTERASLAPSRPAAARSRGAEAWDAIDRQHTSAAPEARTPTAAAAEVWDAQAPRATPASTAPAPRAPAPATEAWSEPAPKLNGRQHPAMPGWADAEIPTF